MMPKKVSMLNSKIKRKKIKSPFMIYADFEIILAPEDNEKPIPEESYITQI